MTSEVVTHGGFWPTAPDRRWWHHVAAAPVLLVLLWWPFVLGRRVPLLGWVDLAVHEFGHVATAWLPQAVSLVMGGGAQVALPLAIAAGLWWRSGDRLGAGLALAWAGSSAHDVSVYVADAPVQALPLIGGLHDWATLLGPAHLDALHLAGPLARMVWFVGLLLGLGGLAVVAADGWRRWRDRDGAPTPARPAVGWSTGRGGSPGLGRTGSMAGRSRPPQEHRP